MEKLSANTKSSKETAVIAQSGVISKKKFFLINGQIINTKHNDETDIVKFEELSIDLSSLSPSTIKLPKVQETNTLKLINCFKKGSYLYLKICSDDFRKELYPVLNRRIVFLLYFIYLLFH